MWVSLEANALAQASFQMTTALANMLTAPHKKILSQNNPAKSLHIPDLEKLYENKYCFKLLNLVVLWYLATDNVKAYELEKDGGVQALGSPA